jgi:hypothetical protein
LLDPVGISEPMAEVFIQIRTLLFVLNSNNERHMLTSLTRMHDDRAAQYDASFLQMFQAPLN